MVCITTKTQVHIDGTMEDFSENIPSNNVIVKLLDKPDKNYIKLLRLFRSTHLTYLMMLVSFLTLSLLMTIKLHLHMEEVEPKCRNNANDKTVSSNDFPGKIFSPAQVSKRKILYIRSMAIVNICVACSKYSVEKSLKHCASIAIQRMERRNSPAQREDAVGILPTEKASRQWNACR